MPTLVSGMFVLQLLSMVMLGRILRRTASLEVEHVMGTALVSLRVAALAARNMESPGKPRDS